MVDMLERLIMGILSNDEIRANYDFFINAVRNNKSRKILINRILDKYESSYLLFCFHLIYDLDEFEDKVIYFLEQKNCKRVLTTDILTNFLCNTSFGKKYVLDNIRFIVDNCSYNMETILEYAFLNDVDMIKKLVGHSDMHLRYLVMNCLIEKYSEKLDSDYKYIFDYLKDSMEKTDESKMMSTFDISNLAVNALKLGNKELYKKLKDYILLNYNYNDLGEILFDDIDSKCVSLKEKKVVLKEFKGDIDNLFLTSSRYNFQIYNNYRNLISKELVDNFLYYANMFKNDEIFDSKLGKICSYRLWHELTEYVDKYMELSSDKTYNYVASGFGTSVYRIGDFAFKLSRTKHSYADVICPNLYLILKNLEERYIRDDDTNYFYAGIEVQRYLRANAREVPDSIFKLYKREMEILGYYVEDKLMYGRYGDNCMLLDNYRDADCSNPEELPDWFKNYPVVLVDRDLVYKLERKK